MKLVDEAVRKGYMEEAFQMLTYMLVQEYEVVYAGDGMLLVNDYLVTLATDHYIVAHVMRGVFVTAVIRCTLYDDVQYWLRGAVLYA